MLTNERHELIIKAIKQRGNITLQELTDLTKCSTSTVRRDLSQLEKEGLLKRIHGGATEVTKRHQERRMSEKATRNLTEKREIARLAASHISDGDTIYLDAGTTTLEMIPFIQNEDIIVVTNGLTHVFPLLERGITVYLTGGKVKASTLANIGGQAIVSLQKYRFDKVFIGMNGIDLVYGLTTPDPEEAIMKETALFLSSKSYVLADQTKFNEVSFSEINLEKPCEIITSKEALINIDNIEEYQKKYTIYGG